MRGERGEECDIGCGSEIGKFFFLCMSSMGMSSARVKRGYHSRVGGLMGRHI
jgi:hypothetical protein